MDRFVDEFKPRPTDVAVCGSMAYKERWIEIIGKLRAEGLTVSAPDLSENSDWSAFSDEEVVRKKGWLIRRHFANIASAKVVLICNYDKNDTKGYVGGNCFLEMGAAFVYGKPVFLLGGVPEQDNREEILALEPVVLNGDLNGLIEEVKK